MENRTIVRGPAIVNLDLDGYQPVLDPWISTETAEFRCCFLLETRPFQSKTDSIRTSSKPAAMNPLVETILFNALLQYHYNTFVVK